MPSNSNRRHRQQQPTAVQLEQAIRAKFDRLAQLQTQIANAKTLYAEHDALVEELMPMFITRNSDGSFSVAVNKVIGNRTFRLNPTFFNAEKNKLMAKTWRSTATPTISIEA